MYGRRLMKSLLFSLAAIFVIALGAAGLARADQPAYTIYDDALASGWTRIGAASVNLNNADPVHSGLASISVSDGPYQVFCLCHFAFIETSDFATLSFWINGGPAGGQELWVKGTLNGVEQTAIALPALPAGTWQQVTLPLTALGVANQPNLTGFWIQESTGNAQPTFYVDDIQLNRIPPPAIVNVAVDASQIVRTVDARQFGIATHTYDGFLDTPTTLSILSEAGSQALRFPGGSVGDEYDWQTNTLTDANGIKASTSFDGFAHVATATGAQVFIVANYGSGTPQMAAEWVRYLNITKGYGFKYWEVGNETYGAWETDHQMRPNDPYTYAFRFRDYFAQMKAIDPSIKVGAVAIPGEDTVFVNYTDHPAINPRTGQSHSGWTPVLLATLKSLGVTPDFLVHHFYPQEPGEENDPMLLQSASGWAVAAADLRQQLSDYLSVSAGSVELVSTETNSVSSNPGKQTTSLVNGLFLADSVAQAMQTEFNALFWHALHNNQTFTNNNDPALYGWRLYGDYGIVDTADPPAATDHYPTFYTFKLLQHFARGGDRVVKTASSYHDLAAYSARRADGSLSLLFINKSSDTSFPTNIALTGYTPRSSATVFSYGIPQDEAARMGIGSPDIVQATLAVGGPNFTYTFQPYSATVIALAPATIAPVIEYYNASQDHYFMTWAPAEIAILDAGTTIKGWTRTGKMFQAYTTPQSGTSPVCRFYIPPALGDSHFYGRGTTECNATAQKNPSFILEDPTFMQMFLPNLGVCPASTTEVYRVFDNRSDANHRYMTDPAVRDQMVAKGWIAEGDGPDLVVMCAPQ